MKVLTKRVTIEDLLIYQEAFKKFQSECCKIADNHSRELMHDMPRFLKQQLKISRMVVKEMKKMGFR